VLVGGQRQIPSGGCQALLGLFERLPTDRLPLLQTVSEGFHFLLEQRLPLFGIAGLLELGFRPAQLHGDLCLADLELRHLLQIPGEPDPGAGLDQPLGRVVVEPANAVAIVGLKVVVKVVIALAMGEQGEHTVVTRRVLIAERLPTPVVGERVDEESGVMGDHQPREAHEQEIGQIVAGEKAHEQGRRQIHDPGDGDVMLLLPHHDGVPHQILNVREVFLAARPVPQHPAHVREPEAAPGAVRISVVVIHVAVVAAVARAPAQNAVLDGGGTEQREEEPQRPVGLVGIVGPETVIAGRDGKPGSEQENHEGDDCGRLEAYGERIPGHADGGHQEGDCKNTCLNPEKRRFLGANFLIFNAIF
jgi:hypothetical protein